MEIVEPTYEEMTIKSAQTVGKNNKTHSNSTTRTLPVIDTVYREYEEIQSIDEAGEDIYEVIPADFAPSSWSEKTSRSSSISSQSSSRSARSCSVATIGIQTDDERVSSSPDTTGTASASQDDDEAVAQYAEIIHVDNLEVTEIVAARPTRESNNPILRQDFAQLAGSNKLVKHDLRAIRKSFTGVSKPVKSREVHGKELPAHLLLKRSLSVGDSRNGFVRKSVDVLYENTPEPSPQDSPVTRHHAMSPTPLYENIKFPFIESDRESHCSLSSGSTEGKSLYSEEDSPELPNNLYENVEEFATESRPRTRSRPIDIVYSDLEFHAERKISTQSSSLNSDELLSTDISRKTKSLSAVQTRPSPPSPRGGPSLARPKSLNLRNTANEALGLCRARFIKKVTVHRSNDKTLQATIDDVLSKSYNIDDEPFVNVEVNSDLVRISTDYPPWEVIASCEIETVGHVNVYKGNGNVLGIIVSPLGEESTCYIIRSQQAAHILSTIKTAFRAPNLKVSHLKKVSKLFQFLKKIV